MIEQFTTGIVAFVFSQDWGFIVPFLAICFIANKWIDQNTPARLAFLRTRYRVFIVGLLYALVVFGLRGYRTGEQVEALLRAYIYAVVFYSLVVDIPAKWLEDYLKKTVRAKLYQPEAKPE